MVFVLKKEGVGKYLAKVNNQNRYQVTNKSKNAWVGSWEVKDLLDEKRYDDFVSLSECKDFIKDEILITRGGWVWVL